MLPVSFPLLTLALGLKWIAEVALMALLGQWVLGRLAGPRAPANAFWRLLGWVWSPVGRGVLWLARPWGVSGWAPARQRALVGWALLLLWLVATAGKIGLCLSLGGGACRS